MAAQDVPRRASAAAPIAPAPPLRRLLGWIYTGPIGHLWSTAADVVTVWARWGLAAARRRYSNR